MTEHLAPSGAGETRESARGPLRLKGRRLLAGTARSLLGLRTQDGQKLATSGDAAMARRDWSAAAEAYDRALTSDPSLNATWVQFGHALKELGRRQEAVYAYRRALELVPGDAETLLHLAHLRLALDDRDEALGDLERVSEMAGGSRLGREASELLARLRRETTIAQSLSRGDDAMRAQRWAEAMRSYAEYLRADPSAAHIWVQFGHALKEQGFLREALRAYREALDRRPEDEDAQLHLVGVLARIGYRLPESEHHGETGLEAGGDAVVTVPAETT